MKTILAIALGGAIGSVARHYAVAGLARDGFPWGTLFVNVAGSLAIGVLAEMMALKWQVPAEARAFIFTGILGGLWEKVRERPGEFLDRRIIEAEGLDVAAKDFVAGMTDRYAVTLFERLFIPRPWVGPIAWNQL